MSKTLRQRVLTACLAASLGLTAVPVAQASPPTEKKKTNPLNPALQAAGLYLGQWELLQH